MTASSPAGPGDQVGPPPVPGEGRGRGAVAVQLAGVVHQPVEVVDVDPDPVAEHQAPAVRSDGAGGVLAAIGSEGVEQVVELDPEVGRGRGFVAVGSQGGRDVLARGRTVLDQEGQQVPNSSPSGVGDRGGGAAVDLQPAKGPDSDRRWWGSGEGVQPFPGPGEPRFLGGRTPGPADHGLQVGAVVG